MVVAAQLATLMLGAAFVPLDPKAERANFGIAETAGIKVLFYAPTLIEQVAFTAPSGCRIVSLDVAEHASNNDIVVEPAGHAVLG